MKRHPLETAWCTSAWDILSAIQHGFRAQVDVKGKLAEFHCNKVMEKLKRAGVLKAFTWQDKDGQPDFVATYRGGTLRIECKNVRSGKDGRYRDASAYKVELQKTRNPKTGEPTRGYKPDDFDVLAACPFNQTGKWTFLYIATRRLERRPDKPEYLRIMQPVPLKATGHWKDSLADAIKDATKK